MPESKKYLSGLLERTGLFSAKQISDLTNAVSGSDVGVCEIILRDGLVDEEALLESMAKVMRMSFVRLASMDIDKDVLVRLPPKVVFQNNAIPVSFENGTLIVATVRRSLKTCSGTWASKSRKRR